MVRLEAGGPDHASNSFPGEVQYQVRRIGNARGLRPFRRLRHAIKTVAGGPLVEGVEKTALLEIRQGALVGERTGELGPSVGDACKTSHQPHAIRCQRVEVETAPRDAADKLR